MSDRVRDRTASGAFAPLTVPAYRRMWLAMVVSSFGTFLQLTVAPWLMQVMTGSPLMVSLVTTALFLPRLLLTLPSGALADVLDRRTLIVFGQVLSAAAVGTMAVLEVLDALTPSLLLSLTLLLGIGNAVNLPAIQTLIPDLVPRPMLAQGITLQSAAGNVARALGPSAGGALAALGLASAAFAANAVSFLAVVGVVLTLPKRPFEEPGRRRLWRSTIVGWRYSRFTPTISRLLLVSGGFFLTTACVQALLPSFVSDELDLGAGAFGLLFGAFGLGALIAAVSRERAASWKPHLVLPGSILGFGAAGIALGYSTGPYSAATALFGAGLCWVWTVTTLNASLQTVAPEWVRGRVVSLFLLMWGLQPIGALLAGVIAEGIGTGHAIAALTGLTLILGIGLLRLELPALTDMEEATPVSDSLGVAGHPVEVGGTPILVTTTWKVATRQLPDFLEVMRELRRQRLRTGATRWSLFRDATDPETVTEMFTLPDWDEHLAQHARLDEEAREVIARARSFARGQHPTTRHLAGIDVSLRTSSPLDEQLITVHADLHRSDGSIPL